MSEFLRGLDTALDEVQKKQVLTTREFAKGFFDKAKQEGTMMGAHGLDHGTRVVGNALLISQGEGVHPLLPTVTALLMDTGRSVDDPRSKNWEHGFVSAEITEEFLQELGLTREDRTTVLNAMRDHSRLNEYVENKTPVVKVVMDADRLATLGPLGPLRAAATRPQLPLVLPESHDTGSVDDEITSVFQDVAVRQYEWFDMLWTATAKKLAEGKKVFHLEYVNAVIEDVRSVYAACEAIGLPLDFS